MFSYTRQDYLELEKIFCKETNMLKDTETEYHYDISKEEHKKLNEKHQRHDKIVRDILNDKEEVVKIINKYVNVENELKKEEKRENLKRIVEYLLDDKLLKDEMEEIKEKLKNEERNDIMRVHEVIRRDREKYAEEARKAGIKTGIKTGKLEQAILDAQKMLAEKLDVNLIMKITGLKKEQFMK